MIRAPNQPHPRMPAASSPFGGWTRERDGYLVTAREQESDQRIVLHRNGRDALARVCVVLDALDGDWRVLSISSPDTIYRDLQGTREHEWKDSMQYPEPALLGRIGRLDLLDPSLEPRLMRGTTHG